jgi:hypothetical protein
VSFLLKWFLIDRLIMRLVRHPRVQAHPVFQHAGPAYLTARPHLFPLLVRRLLLGVVIATLVSAALIVALAVLLIEAIH